MKLLGKISLVFICALSIMIPSDVFKENGGKPFIEIYNEKGELVDSAYGK